MVDFMMDAMMVTFAGTMIALCIVVVGFLALATYSYIRETL
jgi:hypothetical protein